MAMVVVLVSGLVIWIPRSRKALKSRLSVSVTKGWKRFLYDSHVSIGFYCTLLLLLMALTGLTWSFGWYREAAYALTGDMEPQAAKRLFFSLHTGSWGGIVTKILYFIAALAGGLLPLLEGRVVEQQEVLVHHDVAGLAFGQDGVAQAVREKIAERQVEDMLLLEAVALHPAQTELR